MDANVERFMGFADLYDAQRPRPPEIIIEILTQLAQAPQPGLVVDLGSGTGLSTMIWAGRAAAVVGVEPSADMRRVAEVRAAGFEHVRYQDGRSDSIGLADSCADIVTASQALHWMEPAPTFAEVARILRPGGIFAAYDCDWPPTFHWQVEQAYDRCIQQANAIEQERGLSRGIRYWNKRQHLERMRSSGHFRFTKEIKLHQVEQGNAERLVGLALSQGQVATLFKHGISQAEIGIDDLRQTAQAVLGNRTIPWYWSYRMRMGVK